MSQQTMILVSAGIAALAILAAVLSWAMSARSSREYRAAVEEGARAKEQKIAGLEREVEFLKELDSVKFTQRYLETKNGLDERVMTLRDEMGELHEREQEIRRRMTDLSSEDQKKAAEIARLRSELAKNLHAAQRLEQVVEAVYSVGPIPITDVKEELARRRRLQAEIKGRIEQLGLEGEAKAAEVERLHSELDRIRHETERLRREIEVTRSAGPIVDALLGITSETREKFGVLGERLDSPLRQLLGSSRRDPVAEFLSVFQGGRRGGRLLGAGAERDGEADGGRKADAGRGAGARAEDEAGARAGAEDEAGARAGAEDASDARAGAGSASDARSGAEGEAAEARPRAGLAAPFYSDSGEAGAAEPAPRGAAPAEEPRDAPQESRRGAW